MSIYSHVATQKKGIGGYLLPDTPHPTPYTQPTFQLFIITPSVDEAIAF